MITPNEFKSGTLIKWKDGIYEVLSYQRSRTAQRRAKVLAKIRNIETGAQFEESFESEIKLESAEMERRKSQYMFSDDFGYNFMDMETYDQFALGKDLVGDKALYLTDNLEINIVYIEGKPATIEPPMFLVMEVTETAPDFRGDTATGGGKPATLSTGLTVSVPFFIKIGDKVKIDTRTNSYVERANG